MHSWKSKIRSWNKTFPHNQQTRVKNILMIFLENILGPTIPNFDRSLIKYNSVPVQEKM